LRLNTQIKRLIASRPWAGLPIHVPHNGRALFKVAVESVVGNGRNTMFWTDRWLGGKNIEELDPNLLKTVTKRAIKQHMVADANAGRRWVSDIKGALSVPVLHEYLLIWDLVDDFPLQPKVTD